MARIRSSVRAGFVSPGRGPRGEYRFSFQDLVILRTARGLLDARVPARRVHTALARLKEQLPRGRSLTDVRILAAGSQVLVHDGAAAWDPESGQAVFDFDVDSDVDFEVAALARKVAPIARRAARQARSDPDVLGPDDWYELGCELEATDAVEARDAYRRAIELDPGNPDAHINLGRLLHAGGELAAAEAHYRIALTTRPDDGTAAFNLGVVLQDQGRRAAAAEAYRRALEADGELAEAHYNLALLLEATGERAEAIRHLRTYRSLVQPPPRP